MGLRDKKAMPKFDLMSKKSAWAALATLGVTAIAAGATAIVKMREKRRASEKTEPKAEGVLHLSAEQMMVYNEAVSNFRALNKRIFELRRQREQLQPLIHWLATDGEKPQTESNNADIAQLAKDIEHFLTTQVPFINASLSTISDDGTSYEDYVRGAVGGTFDDSLDEEPTGSEVKNGTPIKYVLKLGYYFPESTEAQYPVKSIVIV